jgi:hypothetical protein
MPVSPVFIFLPILMLPFFITAILSNLGLYRKLSKKTRYTAYLISVFALFFLQKFIYYLVPHSGINGLWLLSTYLLAALIASYIVGNKSEQTVVKARWILGILAIITVIAIRVYIK